MTRFPSAAAALVLVLFLPLFAGCPDGSDRKLPPPVEENRPAEPRPAIRPLQEPFDAPGFTLPDLEGNPFTMKEKRGKTVIVLFWATSSKPACKMIEIVNALLAGHPEATAVGLSLDQGGSDRVRDLVNELAPQFPICTFDYEVTKKWGMIREVPTIFIADKEGKVRYSHKGYAEKAYLEPALEALR